MPIFFHNVVFPDDPTGFGVWLNEHYLEHLQMVALGLKQSPPRFIPDYAILSWSDEKAIVKQWLDAHQQIHNALRDWTGVQGIDLSSVDLSDDDEWFAWMDDHAQEHVLLEQALGLT
jgi:hypothetical protein